MCSTPGQIPMTHASNEDWRQFGDTDLNTKSGLSRKKPTLQKVLKQCMDKNLNAACYSLLSAMSIIYRKTECYNRDQGKVAQLSFLKSFESQYEVQLEIAFLLSSSIEFSFDLQIEKAK